jgi:hypothetical protein
MMSQNPFQHCPDDELVGEASSRQGTVGGPLAELMRRLKDAIQALELTSTELNQRIVSLNCWLLRATVAIVVLTVVMVALTAAQTYVLILRR